MDPNIFRTGLATALNEQAFGNTYEPERSFWVGWFSAWNNQRYLGYLRRTGVWGGDLLEVGIGSGSFLCAARKAGFLVSGCDLSVSLCYRVEKETGISIHNGSIEKLPESRWDVLVMNHVLEHVHDPVAFLHAARNRLRPDGVLHIAVPNVACWEATLLPGWTSYEPYHLGYFTLKTLERAVRASGFAIMYLGTHESFSGWFLTCLRTAMGVNRQGGAVEKHKGELAAYLRKVRPSVVEHVYRLAMVGAGAVLWPFRYVQAGLGYGDELICVARKMN